MAKLNIHIKKIKKIFINYNNSFNAKSYFFANDLNKTNIIYTSIKLVESFEYNN